MLGSTLRLGSTCSPTPQGCDFAGRCDPTDCTTAEACINFCVPIFEGDVLGDVMGGGGEGGGGAGGYSRDPGLYDY